LYPPRLSLFYYYIEKHRKNSTIPMRTPGTRPSDNLHLQTDFKPPLAMTGFASSMLVASLSSIPQQGCSTRKAASSTARVTVQRFHLRTFEELPSYRRREHFAVGFWDSLIVAHFTRFMYIHFSRGLVQPHAWRCWLVYIPLTALDL
jgi:hypothetical protein